MRKVILKIGEEVEIQLPNNHHISVEALEEDGGFSVCAWEHDCTLGVRHPCDGVTEFKIQRDPLAKQGE